MRPLRMLSLFSGIGGIDLAAEWAGIEVVGQVELDPFCLAVLEKHWPNVKRVTDVRKVWGYDFGTVDIVAGGFPCQPFSVAGKRRGKADDRHLWPEMLRVIQVYQPAWVVGENVAGFVNMALDDVLADLGAAGYEARAVVLPAAAVGAPHRRERIFIVAHSRRGQCQGPMRLPAGRDPLPESNAGCAVGGRGAAMAHAQRLGWIGWPGEQGGHVLHGPAAGRQQGERDTGDGHADDGQPRQAQPRVGRDADGLPRGLDGCPRHCWPSGPGEAQAEWEAPRTVTGRVERRAQRLKALGNAVVPQQVYPVLAAIVDAHRRHYGEEA